MHFVFSYFFFENHTLYEIVEKYCRARQATDDNMAHAHGLLNTQDYKHTFKLCNINRFSIATMVTRTHLNVALYVHCLPC